MRGDRDKYGWHLGAELWINENPLSLVDCFFLGGSVLSLGTLTHYISQVDQPISNFRLKPIDSITPARAYKHFSLLNKKKKKKLVFSTRITLDVTNLMRWSPPVLPNPTGQCLTAFAGLLTRRRGSHSTGISGGGRPVSDLTDENHNSKPYRTIYNTFNITFTTFRQNRLFETGSSLDNCLGVKLILCDLI